MHMLKLVIGDFHFQLKRFHVQWSCRLLQDYCSSECIGVKLTDLKWAGLGSLQLFEATNYGV